MQPFASTFTEGTLSFSNATTAVITFDGGEYTLVDSTRQHIYTPSSQPPHKLYLM